MSDDTSGNNPFWFDGGTATTGVTNLTFTTGSTDSFTFTVNGTPWHPVIPDKNWMPYKYVEYEPKWHKKFARYKLQMQSMWD